MLGNLLINTDETLSDSSSSSRERVVEGGRKTPRQSTAVQVHNCDLKIRIMVNNNDNAGGGKCDKRMPKCRQ